MRVLFSFHAYVQVMADEALDTLASYFDGVPPKVLITTSVNGNKVRGMLT